MRILYLTPGVFDKGGISRYNRFQIRALREAFDEENVRVFSLMGRQPGDLEEPFSVAFSGAMPLSSRSRSLFAAEVSRNAIIFRPDVVMSAHVNLGPLAFVAARIFRAKLIQNIYGREIWTKAGLSFLRRQALLGADTLISDCHNTADRAVEMGLVKEKPIVVWDCVDTNRYCPGKPNWSALAKYGLKKNGRFKVMFLGRINRFTRYKGFERLLRLVEMLPSDRFEAVIAGKGDDIEHVKALAQELDIVERTVIAGSIDEMDMPNVFRSADAFYLVSEVGPGMGEGIPLTPMEAMACGVPVIVGNQDGSRELLDGRGGWCGDPLDLTGQVNFVKTLANNTDILRKEMGAARERVLKVFSDKDFFQKTISVFNQMKRK